MESSFSGNIIDACPTGVLTSKPFRYKTRLWDLQEAPSICPHCSLGCAIVPGGRYREVQRVRAGVNRETNGFFICDRGRFGYDHVNHPGRPRQPRVDGQPVELDAALAAARERIARLVQTHGPHSVAFLGSSHASLEANALLRDWAAAVGSTQLVFEAHHGRDAAARTLVARLGEQACSLEDVRQSDLIILCGADPVAEGPLLALAVRQAVRKGAKVVVIDPRPVQLPCAASYLPMAPEHLPAALAALGHGDPAGFADPQGKFLAGLASQLKAARRPILAGGADLLGGRGIAALCSAATALSSEDRPVGAMALLGGPNSYGGALLAGNGPGFETLLDATLAGNVRALVCLESDPFREAMDPARAQAALGRLELLVSLDATPSLAAQRADIFLPARANAEMAGSYINNEGRLQAFLPAIDPGLPIRQTGGGNHPPREFFLATPGSAPAADWWLLARLLERDTDLATLRTTLAKQDLRLAGLEGVAAEAPGLRLAGKGGLPPVAEPDLLQISTAETLLLATSAPVGSHWLAHLSAPLASTAPQPYVCLHPELAASLGLTAGDRARLTTCFGHCHVDIRTVGQMVNDLVLAPQLLGTALEGMVPGRLLACRLEKEARA